MPFARPTLTELRNLALQDVYAVLGLKGLLRFAVLRVLSWVQAGMAHLHYGYLDWIALQSVPYTATAEFLEAWAALVGVFRKAASTASGSVVFAGAPTTPIPAGTVLRRAGDAASYATVADATIAGGGTVTVGVVALVAGAAGNADADTSLSGASPLSGVTGIALSGPLAGGSNVEQDAPFRTRMLLRWASPPQGGAATDYVEWALEVPGVSRAWVNPLGMGAGTVVVYTMWDSAEVGNAGFPVGTNGVAAAETRDASATGDHLIVANAIYPLRPVTALVYSVGPYAYLVNFVLHPQSTVPSGVLDAVKVAIDDVFLVLASPLAVEMELSPFETAIAAVPGMPRFTMTSPAVPITAPLGYLPIRGTVSLA